MGYGLKGGQNNYVIIHKLSFVGVTDYKHGLIKEALFFFFLYCVIINIYLRVGVVFRGIRLSTKRYAPKLKVFVTRAPQAAAALREGL